MTTVDFISILGNISLSMGPIQKMISGGAYVLGVLFVIKAINKLGKIADYKAQSPSHEKMYAPMMYLLFGSFLIYLPTALSALSNTAFGVGNPLTYMPPSKVDVYSTIGIFIRTAGLLWFVRGCVLVIQASEPGAQHGPKGLAFIVAGILAINFDSSVAMLEYIMNQLIDWSTALKNSQGY